MIELNIFYTYTDTDFAPRYELNIYKNNLIVNKYYCGMNDTTDTVNNLYIISVIDVSNNDILKIIMSKDNIENSTNHIKIMKNSFINYKTFQLKCITASDVGDSVVAIKPSPDP